MNNIYLEKYKYKREYKIQILDYCGQVGQVISELNHHDLQDLQHYYPQSFFHNCYKFNHHGLHHHHNFHFRFCFQAVGEPNHPCGMPLYVRGARQIRGA